MLICQQTRHHLDQIEYLEGAFLTPEVERHLSNCLTCQKYQLEMQALRNLLKNQDRVVAPGDFELRLRVRIQATKRHKQQVWFAWVPTPVLAVIAVFVVTAAVYSVHSTWVLTPNTVSQNNQAVNPLSTSSLNGSTAQLNTLASEVGPQPSEGASVANKAMASVPTRRLSSVSRHTSSLNDEKVLLLLRDLNNVEHFVSVPTVIYGAQPVINTSAPILEADSESQHIF